MEQITVVPRQKEGSRTYRQPQPADHAHAQGNIEGPFAGKQGTVVTAV